MKTYKLGVMSCVRTLEAETADQAIAISLMYTKSESPIALYNTEDEIFTLRFPYDYPTVTNILDKMGAEHIKRVYDSIEKIR